MYTRIHKKTKQDTKSTYRGHYHHRQQPPMRRAITKAERHVTRLARAVTGFAHRYKETLTDGDKTRQAARYKVVRQFARRCPKAPIGAEHSPSQNFFHILKTFRAKQKNALTNSQRVQNFSRL